MNLVLITGAGASRNLGRDSVEMPLMGDWASSLALALDRHESDLAAACHLNAGAPGPDFEKNLGLLLRWREDQTLVDRFRGLGSPKLDEGIHQVDEALRRSQIRLDAVMNVLNRNLYEQFGQRRITDQRAEEAYGKLLKELGNPELVVATTNYDRSAEAGLRRLGHTVDTGFADRGERTRRLNAAGLFGRRGSNTLVLHLHGAVGWYEINGTVEDHYAEREYNSSLGTPALIYPDPTKEPARHAVLNQFWSAFGDALKWSDHVLVLGHSLNDQALVDKLADAADHAKVAITYIDQPGRENIETKLTNMVTPIQLEFGPEPKWDPDGLALWMM
jgi:hypothetical protein